MRFTLGWLKDHLETGDPVPALAHTLSMIGLEVDHVADRSAALAPFVVARVISAEPHPKADRLRVCMVETGTGEPVQVVCGAPNARAGMRGVFAPPGTHVPGTGVDLVVASIRGVESRGMLVSERELGLSDEHAGIIELPPEAPVGARFIDLPGLAGLADPVLDIGLTPNRGDCAGVRGIARDLAAAGHGRLKPAPYEGEPVPGRFASPIGVVRELPAGAGDACPLFVGRYIRGVRNGESPAWLRERLEAVGLRPISALVDITNYFSLDRARPLHVFDADKLDRDIVVRLARPGERLLALDGREYALDETMTVIADRSRALGIAGVMGGAESGCTEATVNVFLESALFDPRRTAETGRKLAIASDARYRFERGVDPTSAAAAIESATRMILELCGGEASAPVAAGAEPDWHRTYRFRPARVATLGGLELPTGESRRILEALGFATAEAGGDVLDVDPPSWRPDIQGEADLVEEVLRIAGYERIPTVPLPRPAYMPTPVLTPAQARPVRARRALAVRGMVEAVTFSFMSTAAAARFGGGDPALGLDNPISADLDCMRPSILPNLLDAARRNADRGAGDGALFEIGPEYHGTRPEDQRLVAAGLRWGRTGPRHWAEAPRVFDAFDAKADALAALAAAGAPAENLQASADAPAWYHPGRSGRLRLGATVLANFGEVHPAILAAHGLAGPAVAFEAMLDRVPLPRARSTGKAKPLLKLSPFQPVERDFAFVVAADVTAEAILRAARQAEKTLIAGISVFDVYAGPGIPEGRKSVAIQVTLQPQERTLTDAEIEAVGQRIVEAVAKATGGELRR